MRYRIASLVIIFILCGCSQPQPLSLSPRSTSTSPFGRSPAEPTAPIVSTSRDAPTPISAFGPTPSVVLEPAVPPTATALPTLQPSPTPEIVIVPATVGPLRYEQRWRSQQQEREVFTPPQLYEARAQTALFWFDPATDQVVEIGTLQGVFPAQAQFTFLPTKSRALEVPYRINGDFGLTSISDALQERMRAAGYLQSVEAFIVLSDSIVPKQ